MENEIKYIGQSAMYYGTFLGILWIITFFTYILSISHPEVSILCLALLVFSPIYAGWSGIRFRKRTCSNRLSFSNSLFFMIIVYLCAAVLSAIACYIYFYYFDNGFILSSFKEQIDVYSAMDIGDDVKQIFAESYDILAKMSASDICMNYFTSNLFVLSILAPVTSLFVFKNK